MNEHGNELASIDFGALIGGPLKAVVEGQAQAALTTVDFVKRIGFDENNQANYLKFKYPKLVDTETEKGVITSEVKNMEIEMPLLSILPIPYVRIEETIIDFNAKIDSHSYSRKTSTESYGVSFKGWFGGIGLVGSGFMAGFGRIKAHYSHRSSNSSGNSINREYSMNVRVKAVQDSIPAGMEKILDILNSSIVEKPKDTTSNQ